MRIPHLNLSTRQHPGPGTVYVTHAKVSLLKRRFTTQMPALSQHRDSTSNEPPERVRKIQQPGSFPADSSPQRSIAGLAQTGAVRPKISTLFLKIAQALQRDPRVQSARQRFRPVGIALIEKLHTPLRVKQGNALAHIARDTSRPIRQGHFKLPERAVLNRSVNDRRQPSAVCRGVNGQ